MADEIRDMLCGGDRRSLGDSARAVQAVARHPELFADLMAALFDDDAVVRMRAADAAEKASRAHPTLLQPWKEALLGPLAEQTQPEVRWHVCQMLPRLRLDHVEREAAMAILASYLVAPGSLVKTFAMQGLADFAQKDPGLRVHVVALIERLTATGTPAMLSRGRQLLKQLAGAGPHAAAPRVPLTRRLDG